MCRWGGRGQGWSLRGGAFTLSVVLGLVFVGPALGSTLTGNLSSAGSPVAGGFVAATGPGGNARAVSDSSGAFSLTLPDGTYRLAANAPGFAAAVADGVVVSLDFQTANWHLVGCR